MSMSSIHAFDGGVVVAPGGETTSTQVHTVFLHEITIIDADQELHVYALFDKNKPTAMTPFFEHVNAFDLADWCIQGDAVQVDLSEVMNSGTDRYSGLLQDLTLSSDQTLRKYVSECTLRTMKKQWTTTVRFSWFSLSLMTDQNTNITYLATPVYNNPKMLDVPDHKVQVEQTDNPNYLAYKIMGDGSTVNVDVVRENVSGQPIDPFLRISALVHSSTDVIKWSDVLAVEDDDYSEFTARINSDIASGIAPVILDDVNDGAVAVLDNINAAGALFRTSTNCNERDVIFTNYVITDAVVSRTTFTKNVLFKNSDVGYSSDADGFVEVKNNRNGVYTYTGSNSLNFLANFDSNDYVPSIRFSEVNPPNFAVKIVSTAATDGTVMVYKKQNGIYTPLMPSVAGGTTVEAGKTYQLTCVGDCWTLAEFEEPTQGMLTKIGDKMYKVVKIENLYWMTENLDWKFSGLEVGEETPSTSEPQANYYNNDESTYGANGNKYGLLYNFTAVENLATLLQNGWRVPTVADWNALITAVGGTSTAGTKLKSTTGWDNNQNGDGSYGFEAFPAGFLHVSGDSGIFGDIGSYAHFWTSDAFSETNTNAIMFTLGPESTATVYNNNYCCSVRLVKDA